MSRLWVADLRHEGPAVSDGRTADRSLAGRVLPPGPPPHADMVWIPGGTFKMGSERHYVEERPVHNVSVDGFWMDRHPVTNADFQRFVTETGHSTFADIAPDPQQYPGALPHRRFAGSLVFVKPPGPVDKRDIRNWWQFTRGAMWCRPRGVGSAIKPIMDHPVVHVTYGDAEAYAHWAGKSLP